MGNFLIPITLAITTAISAGFRTYSIPKVDRPVEYIVIHHTAANEKTVKDIRKGHLARGFKDIAYHYVVFSEGRAESGRNIDKLAAGVWGNSKTTIEIVLVGELHKRKPTAKQWAAAVGLAAKAAQVHKLPYWRIRGHREHALPNHATACPGISDNLLKQFRLDVKKEMENG